MNRRITVRGIIVHDNKLLCVRLTDYRDASATRYWCVPGGGLDDGESILSALDREMVEELGVKPDVGKLLYIQQYKDSKGEQMEFFFHIQNYQDYLNIDLSKTSHGLKEIDKVEFLDPKTNNILPKFLVNEPIDLNQQDVKFFTYF